MERRHPVGSLTDAELELSVPRGILVREQVLIFLLRGLAAWREKMFTV